MAHLSYFSLPLAPKFGIKLYKDQSCELQRRKLLRGHCKSSPAYSVMVTKAHLGEPNKVNMQIGIVKERLWEATPDSVKYFPWKKAKVTLLERLIFLGKKAFKWSLVTLFILNALSDVIFSISRNQELMIPFGLFLGCLMTDFLKETSQEMHHNSDERSLDQYLLGISYFFVLVKFISAYFGVQAQVFLLHVANGGLMQALWLWKSSLRERDQENGEKPYSVQDASMPTDAQDSS